MLLTDLRSLHGEGSRPASEGGAMSATKFTFGRGTNAMRTGACVQGLGLSLVASSRRYGAWASHFAARCSGSDPCSLVAARSQEVRMKIMIRTG